jgi:hypothetical protein
VVYYVTHASLRYRHPIDPVVMLLTAVSIVEALERRRLLDDSRNPPRLKPR